MSDLPPDYTQDDQTVIGRFKNRGIGYDHSLDGLEYTPADQAEHCLRITAAARFNDNRYLCLYGKKDVPEWMRRENPMKALE